MQEAKKNSIKVAVAKFQNFVGLYGAQQAAYVPLGVSYVMSFIGLNTGEDGQSAIVALSYLSEISIGVAVLALLLVRSGTLRLIPKGVDTSEISKMFFSVILALLSISGFTIAAKIIMALTWVTPFDNETGVYTMEESYIIALGFMIVMLNTASMLMMSTAFSGAQLVKLSNLKSATMRDLVNAKKGINIKSEENATEGAATAAVSEPSAEPAASV